MRVARVDADAVRPLRKAVLRPWLPADQPLPPEHEGAVHVAAYSSDEGDERVVGVATVFPDPWPGPEPAAEPGAWRLHGMAVDPAYRRTGVGRAVLGEAMTVIAEVGAPLGWANARTEALAFYNDCGWRAVGEEYVTPETGLPHYAIVWTPG